MTGPGSAADRLRALGLALPRLEHYLNHVNHRAAGPAIHVSGQLPAARTCARQAALNALAVAARTAIGAAGLPRHSPVEIRLVCTARNEP
ncbi:hypothetical protein [Amycolatopsis tolypomycina]|uniref:hypothetical protein n=1 Tax=Amycolatopsis tolypomycina TaxID=208445 RepID=UPI0033BA71BF